LIEAFGGIHDGVGLVRIASVVVEVPNVQERCIDLQNARTDELLDADLPHACRIAMDRVEVVVGNPQTDRAAQRGRRNSDSRRRQALQPFESPLVALADATPLPDRRHEGLKKARRRRRPLWCPQCHPVEAVEQMDANDQIRCHGYCSPRLLAPPLLVFSSETSSFADRKSTRLNSSHVKISYAVFCLKKKK